MTACSSLSVACRPVAHRVGARAGRRRASVCLAVAGNESGPFKGTYGNWSIEKEDELEVALYRGSLNVVAAAFGAGTLAALAPGNDAAAWAAAHGTLLAAAGGAGMASATALIHIYVTPIKRFLQALVAAGLVGGAYLAVAHPDTPLPAYVAQHPEAVWLVGPAFAALTGVAAKEALCYGKKESLALAAALPLLLLGHLTGLAPPAVEGVLAAAAAALLLVFAGRKWTQPVKDDIGDKSVFDFYKLTESEQQERIQELRRMQGGGGMLGEE